MLLPQLDNRGFMKAQIACMLEQGPCDEIGNKAKRKVFFSFFLYLYVRTSPRSSVVNELLTVYLPPFTILSYLQYRSDICNNKMLHYVECINLQVLERT